MKKRTREKASQLLVLVLCIVAISLTVAPASAATPTVPKPATHTETLSKEHVKWSEWDDVSLKVTYTGWLGELDAAACGVNEDIAGQKVPVLKDGSEIRFEIMSKAPGSSYNFCYDGTLYPDSGMGQPDYGWDDCGGGYIYLGDGEGFPLHLLGNGDKTVDFNFGGIKTYEKMGRKLSASQYAYKAQNGLITYTFSAKYPTETIEGGEVVYYPNDSMARYVIASALTINDTQIAEMQKTGTMTFPMKTEQEDLTYTYAYPGLAELLGMSRNQSTFSTTSFETVNPTGTWDSIASYHRVNYKLVNNTSNVDSVDIAVIPCVLGRNFDPDGTHQMLPDRYYPLPIVQIQEAVQPGETVRGSFSPQWGFDADMLKYVVIKLDHGDIALLKDNAIGVITSENIYHPIGRTPEDNQLASDFVHKYFAEYLK